MADDERLRAPPPLRALQLTHGWTAAGESAVEAHGLPHPWSMHEGLITIASAHTSSNPYGGKRYKHMLQ